MKDTVKEDEPVDLFTTVWAAVLCCSCPWLAHPHSGMPSGLVRRRVPPSQRGQILPGIS